MFEVRIRPGKNRLYFTLSGKVNPEELDAALTILKEEVAKLRPRFDTVSNISGLDALDDGAMERIDQINRFLVKMRRGRLIRVVGRSAQAALQFERMSRPHGYSAELAFSLAEADRILDGELD